MTEAPRLVVTAGTPSVIVQLNQSYRGVDLAAMYFFDLHIRTILFLTAFGCLLLAAGLGIVKRLVKSEPVLDDWILGSVLLAAGYLGIALREPLIGGWWTVASYLVMLAGYDWYCRGAARFVGATRSWRFPVVLFAATALGLVEYAVLAPGLPGQIVVMSASLAVLASSNAWTLWRGPLPMQPMLRGVAAGLAAVWALLYVVRGSAALDWDPAGPFLEAGGPLRGVTETLVFAMQSMLTVLLPLMILERLHQQRTEGELKLRVREAQLRIFIEHAPAAIAMFDTDMNYLAVSRRWRTNYRLDDQELIGRSHYEVFPELPPEWKAAHRRALAGEILRGDKERFERADGSVDWVRWELYPWYEADGRIGGLLLFSEIITEEVQLLSSLAVYQEHLEELVAERTAQIERQQAEIAGLYHGAPCGYHSLDANGLVVAINDMELAMLGYAREEVEGRMNIRELLAPDELAGFEARFAKLRSDGSIHDVELNFRRKDGSVLPVVVSANIVRDSEGRFVHSRTVVVDNTERKRADAVLRESTARLALALQVTRVVVFRQEPDLRYSWVANPALGLTAEIVLGRRDEDLFDAGSAAELTAFKREVLATGAPGRREIWVTREGSKGCFDLIAEPTRDAAGKITGLICASADITERKHMEEALLRSNFQLEARVLERTRELRELTVDTALAEERERQSIARDLHDDLGQILHVAKIKLDTLTRLMSDNRTRLLAREVDTLVGDASARVRSLTAQLCPPVLENLGLVPALVWLAEEMERVYGLVVEVEDDGCPKPVTAAQGIILFRAARELLINVYKHAKAQFAIVEIARAGNELVLSVRDEGVGIPDLHRAFEGERGFGLASVRERVRYLNGSMDVDSTPGEGTTVELRLPLIQSEETVMEDVA